MVPPRQPLGGGAALGLVTFVALGVLMGPTSADADLWGHVLFGLDILHSGRLPAVDPYAFTSDVAWVNHEWLAEAIFALGYRTAGAIGLIAVKLAILCAIVIVAQRSLERDVRSPFVRDALIGLLVLSTFARTGNVRPQLFSVLAFTVLVSAIRSADREGSRRVYALPVVFALWANLHGAWITGLFVLGIWCVLSRASSPGARVALFAACGAATLATPYGIGLWQFLHDTVGTSRPEIKDWIPLLALPWPIVAYECLAPALGLVAVMKAGRVSVAYAAMLTVLAAATWRISRVDAFLHCAVILLLAPQLDAWLGRTAREEPATAPPRSRWLAVSAFAMSAAIASRGWIPVTGSWAPDPVALSAIQSSGAKRVLTWFDWGEYAIWHLAPEGIRVSMDGRRETVYSEGTIADHFAFYRATPSQVDYADRLGADLVWLPADLPIVPVLQERSWKIAYRSETSIVLQRSAPRTADVAKPSVAPRFP